MARTQQYTDKRIIEAITQAKGSVHLAAKLINCDPTTIYNRIKENKDVAAARELADDQIDDTAELMLHKLILEGNLGAITFRLSRKAKDRGYGDTLELKSAPKTLEIIEEIIEVNDGQDSQGNPPAPDSV